MSSKAENAVRQSAPVRAARGLALSCKGWAQEAALRMLMNSLDDEVTERPRELLFSGDKGKSAGEIAGNVASSVVCDWHCFEDIVRSLRALENDQTLLVQSGKPMGAFRTHDSAPRILLTDTMAWTCIGSQSRVYSAFETFTALGEKHFGAGRIGAQAVDGNAIEEIEPGAELAGKLIVSGGMGVVGGAQSMAATMGGAAFLGIEVDPERIKRRLKSGYCDYMVNSLDEALRILKNALRKRENISVGMVGNCAEAIPELAERGVVPDLLTDATPAHDPVYGYVPSGMTLGEALGLRARDPEAYRQRALESIARHVEGMLRLHKMGAVTFDSGNDIRSVAFEQGVTNACAIPSAVADHLRPRLCGGRGTLRWIALSGAARDIAVIDELVLELFPQNRRLRRWIESARQRIRFQGLPARVCSLGYGERAEFGLAINRLVRQGNLKAPVALASGDFISAMSSGFDTERIKDGSELPAAWPLLNALLNTASGASWVSIASGGADIGRSMCTQVTVADGTDEMARRIERVLTNGAGMAGIPHAKGEPGDWPQTQD